MNCKANIFKLDNLMLAMGLSIALASGAVKAETSPVIDGNAVASHVQQAEQGARVIATSSSGSNSAQMTYTVLLPNSGGSMHLLFLPATSSRSMASGTSSGGFINVSQVIPQQ